MYWSEKYQLGILTDFLRKKGIQYITEASAYSVRMDLACVQRDTTFSIELKSRDFGRGISQAERNCTMVDYSFLSVYEEQVTENLVERVDSLPIGLLSVDNRVKCLSPPDKNKPSNYARSRVRELVLKDV